VFSGQELGTIISQERLVWMRRGRMSSLPYVRRFQDLVVYTKARRLARDVFDVSRAFPKAERYSLTDQMRRSSGSVGAQIAEAWGKRRYARHFASKLTDADSEQMETQHWILISQDRGYISPETSTRLGDQCLEIGRMLGDMIQRADQFCRNPSAED
jgi:four helix bundle protein